MVTLAVVRMNHLTKAGTMVAHANSSTTNDDHTPTIVNSEKMLLINSNVPLEPTTPCVLNTPNTCTKNLSFYYDIPSSIHTSLSGKFCLFFNFFI